jgi:hypothetical protein
VQLVALCTIQLNVDPPPTVTFVGFANIVIIGDGGFVKDVTVTVAEAVALPAVLSQVMVYA